MSDAESRARWSPLALWHPDGAAPRSAVLGSGCPPALRPASGDVPGDGDRADLVVVWPGSRERGAWLDEALAAAAAMLAADGILYAVLAPLARRRAARLLRAHGLELAAAIAHLPGAATSRYLVPPRSRPLRYALARLVPSFPRARRAARLLLAVPGAERAVAALAPALALVARRPGARLPCEWVSRLSPDAARDAALAARVVAVTSWRARGGPAVLHVLARGEERAALVVKAASSCDDVPHLEREDVNVRRLGPAASAAGARLPSASMARLAGDRPILVQSAVAGRPLAAILAERPRSLAPTLTDVCAWLERWNCATRRVLPLDDRVVEREVLAPAALIAPRLAAGDEYRRWLAARCARVAGAPVPFTASHNDLTMRNVLVDGEPGLGIVDWETGEEASLPLGDLAYAVVDAVAATGGYGSRAAAFARCFVAGGEHVEAVAPLFERARRVLDVAPAVAEIAFHACWLRHAADELRASDGAACGPFLAVVERLAAERQRVCAAAEPS